MKEPFYLRRSQTCHKWDLYEFAYKLRRGFKIQIRGHIRAQREKLYVLMGSALGWLFAGSCGSWFSSRAASQLSRSKGGMGQGGEEDVSIQGLGGADNSDLSGGGNVGGTDNTTLVVYKML